jgi:hypothetical protein
MKRVAILFAATAMLVFGQVSGANFSGPVLGFVPGPTARELLPIRGIPGAARLGDPVSLPNTVTQTYLAPGHAYALAAQGEADPIALIVLRGAGALEATPTLTPISGAMAHPDLVAFCPNGGAAALYSEQRNSIQVFTGLPNAPQLLKQFSNVLLGAASALAVSDDARELLIADATGTVYAVASNGAPVAVYHASQVSALAFVSQSHDAIVCDPVLGSAAILQATSTVRMLQPPSNNGCQPRAAASSADGKTILIPCPAQHFIWSVDRASGETNTYGVKTNATALDRLGATDSFLLSPQDGNGTYWLLTWHADGPVLSFIGAAHAGAQGSGN